MTAGESTAADETGSGEETTVGAEAATSTRDDPWARETAPQTPYTMRQVGIGLVIFAVLAIIVFALPLVVA